MTDQLKVLVKVAGEDQPMIDALIRLHKDIGSVEASRIFSDAPADVRLLCIGLADAGELHSFMARLVVELNMANQLTACSAQVSDIHLVPLPLDAVLVVFKQVVALEVPT